MENPLLIDKDLATTFYPILVTALTQMVIIEDELYELLVPLRVTRV